MDKEGSGIEALAALLGLWGAGSLAGKIVRSRPKIVKKTKLRKATELASIVVPSAGLGAALAHKRSKALDLSDSLSYMSSKTASLSKIHPFLVTGGALGAAGIAQTYRKDEGGAQTSRKDKERGPNRRPRGSEVQVPAIRHAKSPMPLDPVRRPLGSKTVGAIKGKDMPSPPVAGAVGGSFVKERKALLGTRKEISEVGLDGSPKTALVAGTAAGGLLGARAIYKGFKKRRTKVAPPTSPKMSFGGKALVAGGAVGAGVLGASMLFGGGAQKARVHYQTEDEKKASMDKEALLGAVAVNLGTKALVKGAPRAIAGGAGKAIKSFGSLSARGIASGARKAGGGVRRIGGGLSRYVSKRTAKSNLKTFGAPGTATHAVRQSQFGNMTSGRWGAAKKLKVNENAAVRSNIGAAHAKARRRAPKYITPGGSRLPVTAPSTNPMMANPVTAKSTGTLGGGARKVRRGGVGGRGKGDLKPLTGSGKSTPAATPAASEGTKSSFMGGTAKKVGTAGLYTAMIGTDSRLSSNSVPAVRSRWA